MDKCECACDGKSVGQWVLACGWVCMYVSTCICVCTHALAQHCLRPSYLYQMSPLTPKHVLPSRGKRLSQMGGEMLNFPADDLAVLFTPHLWPSVTFHTVAVSTWPVHTGCKGMVAGLEGRDSVLSSQLRSLGSPSCLRTDPLGAAMGHGAQWGTNLALSCPQG